MPTQKLDTLPATSRPRAANRLALKNCRIALTLAAALLVATPANVLAQNASSPAPVSSVSAGVRPLAFEVVSIHEEKPTAGPPGPVQIESTPDGYRMRGAPLMALIQIAFIPSQGGYHFGPDQIVGLPESLGSARYDIDARVSAADLPKWNDPAMQPATLRAMLQAMLADRFKLRLHRDTRAVPVYEMRIGPRGPKFKRSAGATLAAIRQKHPDARNFRGGAIVAAGPNPGRQWLFGVTMQVFGEFISTMAGRPIRDKTGLAGEFDITWQLELPPSSPDGARAAPDFFTSQIQYVVQDQLGLKLTPAMGSMESLVIDQVESPTEN